MHGSHFVYSPNTYKIKFVQILRKMQTQIIKYVPPIPKHKTPISYHLWQGVDSKLDEHKQILLYTKTSKQSMIMEYQIFHPHL